MRGGTDERSRRMTGLRGVRERGPRAAAVTAAATGAVTAALAVVGGWAAPAGAAEPGERISSYEVDFTIRQDGVVHVEETVDYDYGTGSRHGIFRDVPVRERAGEDRDRGYELTGVTVSSP